MSKSKVAKGKSPQKSQKAESSRRPRSPSDRTGSSKRAQAAQSGANARRHSEAPQSPGKVPGKARASVATAPAPDAAAKSDGKPKSHARRGRSQPSGTREVTNERGPRRRDGAERRALRANRSSAQAVRGDEESVDLSGLLAASSDAEGTLDADDVNRELLSGDQASIVSGDAEIADTTRDEELKADLAQASSRGLVDFAGATGRPDEVAEEGLEFAPLEPPIEHQGGTEEEPEDGAEMAVERSESATAVAWGASGDEGTFQLTIEGDEPGALVDEAAIGDTESFLKGLVEAILFVSDRPLSVKEIAKACRLDRRRTEELLELLARDSAGRGIRLEEVGGGFALRSSALYAEYVRTFLELRPVRLSRAQLETLAIVAYRQPITRPEVDDVRGVDCGAVLKGLLERDLIRILGKKDEPGRPILYGTTQAFLELFGLGSLSELPTLKEFTELSQDSRSHFERELGYEAPQGPVGGGFDGDDVLAGDDGPEELRLEGADATTADDAAESGRAALAVGSEARDDSRDQDGAGDGERAHVDAGCGQEGAGDGASNDIASRDSPARLRQDGIADADGAGQARDDEEGDSADGG